MTKMFKDSLGIKFGKVLKDLKVEKLNEILCSNSETKM